MPRIVAVLLILLACVPLAHARSRDLGPIPIDGTTAQASLPDRQKRVIRELACGVEATFIRLKLSLAERPNEIMIAKAAVLAGLIDRHLQPCATTQVFAISEWENLLPEGPALKAAIETLDQDLNQPLPPDPARPGEVAETIRGRLNAFAAQVFGGVCEAVVTRVEPRIVARGGGGERVVEYRVSYSLSPACLARQINSVILDRRFVRQGNPGSSGLPCHLFGSPPEADWDMAVALLTRLTFLLRQAATLTPPSAESADAIDKLQTRLLTLSGGKAQEVHPLWHCGNPDNQYGSARDRLDDNSFYDPDLGRDVDGDAEGSDTGDDFLDFLALLLLFLALIIAGVALALLAALLGAIVGPLVAAIIITLLSALAVAAEIPQIALGALFGGVEETENHLFMQNSSKYLKNQMLIEDSAAIGDSDAVADYQAYNREIHAWLMQRLQRVTDEDFAEFNAKPYGRLSFTALLNLHDFSCQAGVPACSADDAQLITGVAVVGDLTAAKMALGSNQGRRIVPFRRLAHANTDYTLGKLEKDHSKRAAVRSLFELSGLADHQIAAMQLWAGQTLHGPDGHASEDSLAEMIWEATSAYTPHRLLLDLALVKGAWTQTLRHAGWERYSSGKAWLITAGGSESGYAQGLRTPTGTIYPSAFIKWTDRGAGVPTTLMVSSGKRLPACEATGSCRELPPARVEQPLRQDRFAHFIRFEGKVVRWKIDQEDEPMSFNDNFCVHGSFACGINLQIPDFLRACMVTHDSAALPAGRRFSLIDSANCKAWDNGDASDDFFVVVYEQTCAGSSDCAAGSQWGFIEVVPRTPAATSKDLHDQVLAANAANFDEMASKSGLGTFTYASRTNGIIKFAPHGAWVSEAGGVAQAHGALPAWPRAQGDVINRTGTASYTIRNPRTGETMSVDFSDQEKPKRALP
ncbi:hypothetical protein [Accumulibacter sp.]|uniref:hypothetical protein n=1 Tax=Accumulibacter sp. TaxID=2053492 RepID=UPI002CCC6FD0|nr:hypothetical protein [Accumulibacter sp.]HNE39380.1 hypothetical protein [Accumulibacter sp.]